MIQGNRDPIRVIGLDCDDPFALEKYLRRNPDVLKQADMICGGKPLLDKLRHDPELSGRLLELSPPLEPLYESILGLHKQGMKVVVLANGDPLFFGIGTSMTKRLPDLEISISPAVSSVQAACSRVNMPWHNVSCISLHGRKNLIPLFSAVKGNVPVCVLTDRKFSPDIVARILLGCGVDWYNVHVFENMGSWDEKHFCLSMKDCANEFFGANTVMLLAPNKKQPRSPRLGLDERRYRGSYSTKKSVRGAIFELLNIEPAHTVWDVGAGSGIIGLEACSLAHDGQVISIEKNVDRCLDIQENRRVLGAANLRIRRGEAPACLEGLPEPQRIFMGGGFSGEKAMKIFECCVKALPRGGRFVASCILLESFMNCRRFMEYLGWPLEMLQVHAASATTLGPGKHFAPINPVFLLATQKP